MRQRKYTHHEPRAFLVLLIGLFFLSACRTDDLRDTPFRVETTPLGAGILCEVFPDDDDFFYTIMALPAAQCNDMSDKEVQRYVIDSLQRYVRSLNEFFGNEEVFTPQDFIYKGYLFSLEYPLEPETEYVICLFVVNDNMRPKGKVYRVTERTRGCFTSDITFNIYAEGPSLHIEPSNNELYFYDIEQRFDVLNQYYGFLDIMLWDNMLMLEQYGMLDIMLKQGKQEINVYETASALPGDTLYMAIGGFENSLLFSDNEYYKIICCSRDSIGVERQESPVVFAPKLEKEQIFRKKVWKNLRMSKKSSTFAADFVM